MTEEQFTRWEEFAVRMAERYPDVGESRKKRIVYEVGCFFEGYQDYKGCKPEEVNQ